MSTQQQQLEAHATPRVDRRPAHDARGLMTRRQVAAYATLLLGSLASGCTGVRALTKLFPHPCEEHADRVLRAFVATVIPGVPHQDPNLTRAFADHEYPFHSHRELFVYELRSRSEALHGREFDMQLSLAERTQVVQEALQEGGIAGQLFSGAIYLAQASFYGGIYEPGACELIDFPGPMPFSNEEVFYADAAGFCAPEATADGNLA